jgi:hypothetical protein
MKIKDGKINETSTVTDDTTVKTNHNYIADSTSVIEFTFPSNIKKGNEIKIIGKGTGGWTIKNNIPLYDDKRKLLNPLYNFTNTVKFIGIDDNKLSFKSNYPNIDKYYGLFSGGKIGAPKQNIIDYIDMTLLTGNATDRGDLPLLVNQLAGIFSMKYNFFCAGDK